ncbi:MAG: tRNA lysidine(34) synthetase TilS [Bacteroidales bacterium]|jgi:tRNA(Ile)-lysidine synthase|nr:tRNA lysidine(34) synthetase TilS [Bacteroidales bacterium]HOC47103.1 tRNA lysidine(34) synthetase TilS [Bacteroidales bacterium]
MLSRFLEFSEREKLFTGGSRLLLAVSGGIDSMVMAWLFREAGIEYSIAHCNFSLRGDESDGDEEFVAAYARTSSISFFSRRFDTMTYAGTHRISVQMAARELRYDWFRSLIRSEGFDSVAVAHNLNDNVETFLINLSRGTGLHGLTGMSPRTGDIIRPLLFATREEIASYASARGIDFREDRSNAEVKYIRNRIRHKVIPELEKVNPGILAAVADTMKHLSSDSSLVDTYLSQLSGQLFTFSGDSAGVEISSLMALNPLEPHIFGLFRPFGLFPKQTDEVISLLQSGTGRSVYTATHRLLNDRGRIIISPRISEAPEEYTFNSIDEIRISGLFSALRITEPSDDALPATHLTASLDLDLVAFPVTVRPWKPGDRFMPLGMKQMKKISDFLIDLKVPVTEKEQVLLLLSGSDVMWVMGYRIDDRFRVSEETGKIIVLTL